MANQGDRQEYLWRPNDNSVKTKLRYDLEAEHWVKAFKSAEINHRPTSFKSDLSAIGLFFSLVFSLLVLIVAIIIDFIKWARS